MKPRCRVPAVLRYLGEGVPNDAVPGDLVVGNRGAAARVVQSGIVLHLHHVGNIRDGRHVVEGANRIYDNRGGT
jgi:hypothetical protein